jgi:hypothetical protein
VDPDLGKQKRASRKKIFENSWLTARCYLRMAGLYLELEVMLVEKEIWLLQFIRIT